MKVVVVVPKNFKLLSLLVTSNLDRDLWSVQLV